MYDILIIGSGGAALSAAIEASKNTKNIAIISKNHPTSSQTCQAQGGINAVLKKGDDSIQTHIADTLKAGQDIANKDAINFMCKNGKNTIEWLDTLGVPFSRDKNNEIAQRNFGGASKPRTCYSSDYTGLKILHTLYDTCIKNDITFLNDYLVLNLIKDNNENTIKGVILLNLQNGELEEIFSKTIVIASGGYAGTYHNYTTNSTQTTGEMLNIALNIGCELENMEFIQFHPTSLKKNRLLISESARGEGGYLVDQDGKRFIDELKPRDVVARAIYEKIQNGDKVFLDLRHLGIAKIKETMPQEYTIVKEFTNLCLEKDIVEITPSAHYTMGGIKVNQNGETNIKNLFACGECASNGVHGANRLGGNSLLEIITFGRETGKCASLSTHNITNFDTSIYQDSLLNEENNVNDIYKLPNTLNFLEIKEMLGSLMFHNVGLFRNEKKLKVANIKIEEYKNQITQMGIEDKSKIYNTELKEFFEFKNMIELSEVIIQSALYRIESRGAHYRTDYLDTDKSFDHTTIIQKDEKKIRIVSCK